jgi:MOSC domain-containing protein YiiM
VSAGARLLAICVGRSAPLAFEGRGRPETVASGIVKHPVSTLDAPAPVLVRPLGLEGDEQVDLSVHGGLDKAVYVYPSEHYAFWRTVRAQAGVQAPLAFGGLGENLVAQGLLESQVWVGDRLQVGGEVELRVESPRQPCFKFDARMGFRQASKMMLQSGWCGFYCAVVRQGRVAAGDAIRVVPGERVVSIEEMNRLKQRGRKP